MSVMTFQVEDFEMGIFFNERVARSFSYSIKKSKVKGINLAMSKNRIVGVTFNTREVTSYKTLSDFFVKQLKIEEEETESIMNQIVGLAVYDNQLSDTIH